jgi:hypothetical protein
MRYRHFALFESEMYSSHMSQLNKLEIHQLLRQRLWTVTALAERWGLSRRHVTSRIANQRRGQLWDDAFRGLPEGPGLYRRLGDKKDESFSGDESGLLIGSLVASEADMDTFAYGSRGVIVEILNSKEWRVVWDGGTVMDIDAACLGR